MRTEDLKPIRDVPFLLSVCKWADECDGERHAFGISFVTDSPS